MKLENVTLICIDCVNPELSLKVLEICQRKIEFGSVKLLTHLPIESEYIVKIEPLTSLIMYSVFCLTELYKYVDTTHMLIVQNDGFILNPDKFQKEWLNLDYIAPLFVQMDVVGSGGFSLRSKRLMEYSAQVLPKWNGTESHANEIQERDCKMYEDGVLCLDNRFKNFKFATKEQASNFAQGGNRNPEYFCEQPFGFHRTWQEIDFETGLVDSTTVGNTLKNSYAKEINEL